MNITQLTGLELLHQLTHLNANSATIPEAKQLLSAITNSSAENKERLALELLGIAEEEVRFDVCLSESLSWAVAWCSSVRVGKRDQFCNGLVSILKKLSERLMAESKGKTSGQNPPFIDFTIALVGLRKIDPELCQRELKHLEELSSGGLNSNLSTALKQFKAMKSETDYYGE